MHYNTYKPLFGRYGNQEIGKAATVPNAWRPKSRKFLIVVLGYKYQLLVGHVKLV